MAIRRVVPNLTVDEVARSRDFYVGVLGFDVAMDMGWIVTLASPSNETAQVSLQEGGANGAPGLTIEVDDVDAVYSLAQRQGADIVRPLADEDWGVRRFFLRDPGGVVVNVMSHRAV